MKRRAWFRKKAQVYLIRSYFKKDFQIVWISHLCSASFKKTTDWRSNTRESCLLFTSSSTLKGRGGTKGLRGPNQSHQS